MTAKDLMLKGMLYLMLVFLFSLFLCIFLPI